MQRRVGRVFVGKLWGQSLLTAAFRGFSDVNCPNAVILVSHGRCENAADPGKNVNLTLKNVSQQSTDKRRNPLQNRDVPFDKAHWNLNETRNGGPIRKKAHLFDCLVCDAQCAAGIILFQSRSCRFTVSASHFASDGNGRCTIRHAYDSYLRAASGWLLQRRCIGLSDRRVAALRIFTDPHGNSNGHQFRWRVDAGDCRLSSATPFAAWCPVTQ